MLFRSGNRFWACEAKHTCFALNPSLACARPKLGFPYPAGQPRIQMSYRTRTLKRACVRTTQTSKEQLKLYELYEGGTARSLTLLSASLSTKYNSTGTAFYAEYTPITPPCQPKNARAQGVIRAINSTSFIRQIPTLVKENLAATVQLPAASVPCLAPQSRPPLL